MLTIQCTRPHLYTPQSDIPVPDIITAHLQSAEVCTVKLVYNDTSGATKMCCYNQVVVVTRTFSTETIESAPAMCVVVKRLMLQTMTS